MVREVTSKVRFQLERRRRESGGGAHSSWIQTYILLQAAFYFVVT
jgi:hypothetical protein